MTPSQEAEIIINCQEGRREDFAVIYDEYVSRIYRYIFYKTHHKETAEDLTSTVFIKALENINKFSSDKASFSVWIYSIARNTVIDHYRTKKETVNIEDIFELPLDELNIHEKIDVESKIKEVREYLEKLNPEQREVVILRVWEGLSYKEIAGIMGKTENSSKVMFSRVMADLRKNFGPVSAFLVILAGNLNG